MTVAQWHRNQIIRGPLVIGCALIWSKTNLMKINLYLTATFYGSFMDTSKITHNKPFKWLWGSTKKT
jgi:hypothetical protein